jgi:hypothetical protein
VFALTPPTLGASAFMSASSWISQPTEQTRMGATAS